MMQTLSALVYFKLETLKHFKSFEVPQVHAHVHTVNSDCTCEF